MNVIMNRCAKPGWWSRQKGDGVADDTVQAVCRDPWQFSCWNPNDPNLGRLLQVDASNDAFREALELVDLALSDQLPDITFGATHYHALEVAPAWAQTKSPCAVYGRHAFYNDIN